jgi:hypothetical protein
VPTETSTLVGAIHTGNTRAADGLQRLFRIGRTGWLVEAGHLVGVGGLS